MKTLQEQFNLLKEGKGHKDMFMKSARTLFPQYINQITPYETAVTILKQKQILSERLIGMSNISPFEKFSNFLSEEAKAVEKSPTKSVTDMGTRDFDFKNPKNIDNVYGQEFLEGYYAEMKDPKNEKKTVDELKIMVAKNLAKDPTYYTTNQAFGIMGIGYQTEAPGLGTPKEAKGKYKASGYGDIPKKTVKETRISLVDLLSENEDNRENEAYYLGAEKDDASHIEALEKDMKDNKKAEKENLENRLRRIEVEGNVAALESKIRAIEEEVMNREGKLSMVRENDAIAEFINPNRIKEIEREIKELSKAKDKYEKLLGKVTGSNKKKVIDETSEEE